MAKTKGTDELMSEIEDTSEIELYLKRNSDELGFPPASEYLKGIIAERGMKMSEAIALAGIERSYGYQILAGDKKYPSRGKLLAFAFGLGLTLDETQCLLKYGQENVLYARDPADSIMIHALQRGISLMETNERLLAHGFEAIG